MSQFFKIGKFATSHGLAGELVLQHHLGKKSSLKGLQAIYLQEQKSGNFIPYFIEKASARTETETLVKLEDITSMEAARLLTPKEVWLESADFQKHAAKTTPIGLLGFTLSDKENVLGEIIEVIEQPHQILCTVLFNNKEILIPVHDDNLISMHQKKKIVVVDVPEGLIDIYK